MKKADARIQWLYLMGLGTPNIIWYRLQYGKNWEKKYNAVRRKHDRLVKKYAKIAGIKPL